MELNRRASDVVDYADRPGRSEDFNRALWIITVISLIVAFISVVATVSLLFFDDHGDCQFLGSQVVAAGSCG